MSVLWEEEPREARWERRANLRRAKRGRMHMSGRGLITTAAGVAKRPVKVAARKLRRKSSANR